MNWEKIREFDIPYEELGITPERVLRFLNIDDGLLADFSRETLIEFLKHIPGKIQAKGGYAIIGKERLKFNKSDFLIDETLFHSDKVITPKLKKADKAALFVATAGSYFEDVSRRFMSDGDSFTAYLVDAAASEVAEAAAEWVDNRIGEYAESIMLKTTSRYSPGYCGWSVSEQHKLFSFLPDNFCGIKLTSSALMIPIKSVSGIIGVGENVKKEEYQCEICEDINCYRRNI